MTAEQFHNALRIMMNLSASDLRKAGVVDENWGTPEASHRQQLIAFIANPFAEALRMPDANFAKLYALIERWQPVQRELNGIRKDIAGIARLMDDAIEALSDASEYFDKRADADHNGHTFVGNEEMRLKSKCDQALAGIDAAAIREQASIDSAGAKIARAQVRS